MTLTALPNLDDLLKYRNIQVLKRYTEDYPNNNLVADEAFVNLLKFLWLSVKHDTELKIHPSNQKLNFHCGIHFEMKEIDDMWHTFLLFTKDYSAFCKLYFKEYIHHSPNTNQQPVSRKTFKRDFTRFLSYVYDNLGEDTTLKWFGSLLD